MNAPESRETPPTTPPPRGGGLLSRHPRLSILLIAGVFYVVLLGMAVFVFLLLARG
jgi:hypothetical protein